MSLKKLFNEIDIHSEGEVFQYGNPTLSLEDVDQFNKDLVDLKKTDIPEKYRVDVRGFLSSNFPNSGFSKEEIQRLNTLLLELQEDL